MLHKGKSLKGARIKARSHDHFHTINGLGLEGAPLHSFPKCGGPFLQVSYVPG